MEIMREFDSQLVWVLTGRDDAPNSSFEVLSIVTCYEQALKAQMFYKQEGYIDIGIEEWAIEKFHCDGKEKFRGEFCGKLIRKSNYEFELTEIFFTTMATITRAKDTAEIHFSNENADKMHYSMSGKYLTDTNPDTLTPKEQRKFFANLLNNFTNLTIVPPIDSSDYIRTDNDGIEENETTDEEFLND